jgi:Spy/CpxP family protein refolding chaperone
MRKRISLLVTALMLALTMSFGGATAAFAANPNLTGNHLGHQSKPCQNSGGKAGGGSKIACKGADQSYAKNR